MNEAREYSGASSVSNLECIGVELLVHIKQCVLGNLHCHQHLFVSANYVLGVSITMTFDYWQMAVLYLTILLDVLITSLSRNPVLYYTMVPSFISSCFDYRFSRTLQRDTDYRVTTWEGAC